jgi:hypothetical protein
MVPLYPDVEPYDHLAQAWPGCELILVDEGGTVRESPA